MKRLLLVSCLAALSALATAGDKSSGGGDPLRFDFEEGKAQAIFILDNLSDASFDEATSPEVRKYLLDYRDKLSKDLAGTDLDWNAPQSQATCAHTDFRPKAKVELSFGNCRGRIYSKEDAGKVLIHEASHHWGVTDETFADRVGLAAYQAWESKKLTAIPFCSGQEKLAKALPGRWQVQNAINQHLPGQGGTKFSNITLTDEPDAIKGIPGVGRCAYLAGKMSIEEWGKVTLTPVPYILTEWRGTLILNYFIPLKDGTFNGEFSRITFMTERAANPKGVLFVGGDHEDEPYTAFEKVPPKKP